MEIIRSLPYDVNIYATDECDARSDYRDSSVTINPNFNPLLSTSGGPRRPSLPSVLAHELAHLLQDLAFPVNGLSAAEAQLLNNMIEMQHIVLPWENPIREELGEPIRLQYEPLQEATCGCR